jgi:hypothetical protein
MSPSQRSLAHLKQLGYAAKILERWNALRAQFRNQGDEAGTDHQIDDRGHDELEDEVEIVLHAVSPWEAGCRHLERSVERASALLSQFLNEEHAEGKPQEKHEHQE